MLRVNDLTDIISTAPTTINLAIAVKIFSLFVCHLKEAGGLIKWLAAGNEDEQHDLFHLDYDKRLLVLHGLRRPPQQPVRNMNSIFYLFIRSRCQ